MSRRFTAVLSVVVVVLSFSIAGQAVADPRAAVQSQAQAAAPLPRRGTAYQCSLS